MVNQNKTFSFRITRQAKNVFPENVERTEMILFSKILSENWNLT